MVIKTKKELKKSFLLLPLILFLAIYTSIPEKITIFEGQKQRMLFGISAKADNYFVENGKGRVMLFNIFPVKTVSVSAVPRAYVIPSGEAIGVKLYTDGVLVIGAGSVSVEGGKTASPAKDAGIMAGDRIMYVNGKAVSDSAALKSAINSEKKTLTISVMRGDKLLEFSVTPVYSKDTGRYLVGLWVRDSAAGIGTLTFYNPQNSTFAALGHGICDFDTDVLMKPGGGSINFCKIKSIKRSEDGAPGEIMGEFSQKIEGNIIENSQNGIFGNVFNLPDTDRIPVASRFEVNHGKAEILCDIDGLGVHPYSVEITKIWTSARPSGKNFVFKVTDPVLLQKTGGIVQGMSGSPVIQNGMLIGAVTHVFVNDASKGYGIFAESMLDSTVKVQ